MAEKQKLTIAPIGHRTGMIWQQERDFVAELKEDGETKETSLGQFSGSFYPGSNQTIRPEYRTHKGKFLIVDADGNEWDNDRVVNELLSQIKLRYGVNHPLAGQVIEECDITDPDDPFLSHKYWEERMQDGILQKQEGKFIGPIADMARGNDDVSLGAAEDAVSGDKRFRIVDEKLEGERKEAAVQSTMDAFEYFRAMKDSRERMEDVLTLLNEVVQPDMSIGAMQALLLEKYVNDNKTTEGGIRRQDLFIKFASKDREELVVRRYIRTAIRRNVILDEGGSYLWRGARIGVTSDDLYHFFTSEGNDKQFDLLREQINSER